jgi:hypothetical protein
MIKERDYRMIDRVALVAQLLSELGDQKAAIKIKSRSVLAGMGDILWEVHGYFSKRLEMMQNPAEYGAEKMESANLRAGLRAAKGDEPAAAEKVGERPPLEFRSEAEEIAESEEGEKKGLWDE